MDTLAPQLGRAPARPLDGVDGLNALTAVKLWENPCWLSFRINYLALGFNVPVYDWVAARFGLKRPDFVVLYSLFLKDGVAAKDICVSSGFPKNTVSRAVGALERRALVRRELDEADRRSFVLRLTPAGRACVDETMPIMLARERTMVGALSHAEQHILYELLAKMVIDSPSWATPLSECSTPPSTPEAPSPAAALSEDLACSTR